MPTTSSRPPQLPAVLCRHFEVVNGRKGRALVGAGGWWRQAGGLTETSSLKRCYQQADDATMLEVVLGGAQLREGRGSPMRERVNCTPPVFARSRSGIKLLLYPHNGAWRSSVARLLWEQEVPGSNPGAPTSSPAW